VDDELSRIVNELNEQGMADLGPPRRPAGAAERLAIQPDFWVAGRCEEAPGRLPKAKYAAVGTGFIVSCLECLGLAEGPSVTRQLGVAAAMHATNVP